MQIALYRFHQTNFAIYPIVRIFLYKFCLMQNIVQIIIQNIVCFIMCSIVRSIVCSIVRSIVVCRIGYKDSIVQIIVQIIQLSFCAPFCGFYHINLLYKIHYM